MILGFTKFDEQRGEFVAVNLKLAVTQVGDHVLGFVQTFNPKHYTIFLIEEYSSQHCKIRYPDENQFMSLIRSEQLEGTIAESDSLFQLYSRVTIRANEDAFRAILEKETVDTLFPAARRVTYFRNKPPEGSALSTK